MKGYNRAGQLKRVCTHTRRKQRQEQAIARNAEYAKLTKEEKLARLDFVPGESKRQRAKLLSIT